MANTTIQLKHSTITGNVPVSLANGEISINSRDGKFFYSTPSGTIITHYPFTGPTGLDTEIQFNDGGILGASDKLTFNKTTGVLTVNGGVTSNVFTDDGVDVYTHATRAFTQANSSYLQANTPSYTANSAASYANAAFGKANTAAVAANTPSHVANSAASYANSAFARANNSLDANNGGTVTGTITATSFITSGSFGNITGANTIYANNFIANTGSFIAQGGIASTSNSTGAIQVVGGVGVKGNVYVDDIKVANRIDWPAVGYAPPSFTNRSAGTKLTIYPAISGSSVDYAIGINGGVLWTSVPEYTSSYSFKWYGGDIEVASISGTGQLTTATANIISVTSSTSNATGALTVQGGVGVKGNVATDGVIFADGTRQTTAASGGGASIGDVLALSIALG